MATYQGGVSLNAEVGSAYGVLYGTDYVYTNGQKTIDPNTGRYLRTAESNKNIGNITPGGLVVLEINLVIEIYLSVF